MIDFTFPHYFHSETTPSNKEEMLDAIENADLSVVSNFTDNPTIKINSNNKLLVQFRARVDADQRADGYKILLRQLLEAGTGFFYL